jgi:hypothetical protein
VLAGLAGEALPRLLGRRDDREPAAAAELAGVERQLDDLAEAFGRLEIGRREWLVARRGLGERRERLTAALADQARGSALAPLMGPGTLAERWERLTFDQQHAALVAVLDRVIVGPAVRGRNYFDPGRLLPPVGDIVWRV